VKILGRLWSFNEEEGGVFVGMHYLVLYIAQLSLLSLLFSES
jgi:hypothetical protein